MEVNPGDTVNSPLNSCCAHELTTTPIPANSHLQEVLARRGISHLLPVQQETITRGLLDRRSFLVCAPSGSGKTLVGELAAVSAILDHRGRVAYLVPYRALAAQKAAEFRHLYEPMGIRVVLATGDEEVPDPGLVAADIVVTTFEKLDSALRNAKVHAWVRELAVVVADEFHEIGEPKRGPHLEGLLMRLLQGKPGLQLIALSATVGNPQELVAWLNSLGTPVELVTSSYRPVPLSQTIATDIHKDHYILRQVKQVLEDAGQVLVFTATRKEAEQQASSLAGACQRFLTPEDRQHIAESLKTLSTLPGHSTTLKQVINAGVGFHHAGLDRAERAAVERLYNARVIKVVCCTTTLAAGINTPARLVILRGVEMKKSARPGDLEDTPEGAQPWVALALGGSSFLPFPPNQVFQLLGRAGRPGFDPRGHGIILTSSDTQATWARQFYFSTPESDGKAHLSNIQGMDHLPPDLIPRYAPLRSRLDAQDLLRELVLVRIHEMGRATLAELRAFFQSSLYYFQQRLGRSTPPVRLPLGIISFLLTRGFIRRVVHPAPDVPLLFEVTRLGALTTRLYVPPSKSLIILDLLSQETPVTISTLLRLGCTLLHGPDSRGETSVSMLERWIAEMPVEDIVRRAGKSLGDLAVVNLEVSRFLKIVARFADYIDHPEVAELARTLALRVLHGVKEELLGLVTQVPGVGRSRGRSLVNAGYITPDQIANSSLATLARDTKIPLSLLTEIKRQCSHLATMPG